MAKAASKAKRKSNRTPEITRQTDLTQYEDICEELAKLFKQVEKGFEDQYARSNDLIDYWDLYNCKLGPGQFYSGNAKIFIPIVHNAIRARVTRFTNQIFPLSNRNIELITTEESKPEDYVALIENYIQRARLRTKIVPALVLKGDVEGQYTVYVSWRKTKRHVTMKVKQQATVEVPKEEPDDPDVPIPEEDMDDILHDIIVDGRPDVEVINDADLLVLPNTSDSIDDALRDGGSVTVLRRWGKSKLKKLVKEQILNEEATEGILERMEKEDKAGSNKVNTAKEMVDAAGIKTEGSSKYALVYETWAMLDLPNGERRICVAYMGGEKVYLGCHLNPNWSDRCSIISVPVEKVAGSFKGISKLKQCYDMQIFANDVINEAADNMSYSLLPITMTDPNKNPRTGSMVLALGAVWETSPQDTQFAQMPAVWTQAMEGVAAAKSEIAETLSVNPAAITQVASGKKRNQAELANEQQVDILTTADAVTVIEEGILSPLANVFAELDHQYRDEPTLVNAYGELGIKATMVHIPPIRMETGFNFKWFGVEAARSAQQIQQQMSGFNIIRTIPPQMYQGWKINIVPVLQQFFENLYGARLAGQIFTNLQDELTIEPEFENLLLSEGIGLPVHMLDNDKEHIMLHSKYIQEEGGDPTGQIRIHIMKHQQQIKGKEQMQAMQQLQSMQPQGMGGGPRPGASTSGPRGGQGPNGAIHQDRMRDPRAMPRR